MIAEAENSVGWSNHVAIQKTYGRKKRPHVASSIKGGKRRESNASLSSFLLQTGNSRQNVPLSPFKSLQKYLRAGVPVVDTIVQNVFDMVPNISPIQINALVKPSHLTTSRSNGAKKRIGTPLLETISEDLTQQNYPQPSSFLNQKANDLQIIEPLLKKQESLSLENPSTSNNFSRENFCLCNSMVANPFIESAFSSKLDVPVLKQIQNGGTDVAEKALAPRESQTIKTNELPEATVPMPSKNNDVSMRMFLEESPALHALLLNACDQEKVLDFNFFMTEFRYLFHSNAREHYLIGKIGESSYSEVFKCTPVKGRDDEPPMALKIIPIDLPNDACKEMETNKDDSMVELPYRSRPRDVLHELLITQTLSPPDTIPPTWNGFVRLYGAALVSGSYPSILIESWHSYEAKFGSENLPPSLLDRFSSNQHYMILLLEYGGTDLDHFSLDTLSQLKSLFSQLTIALYSAQKVFIATLI